MNGRRLRELLTELTDVSEMGEQWSPKSPPPSEAAIATCVSIPIWFEIGTAIAIIIANVPHDVPVEKDIKQLVKNNKTGINLGEIILSKDADTYWPVPSSLHRLPIAKANKIKTAIEIIPDIPFKVLFIISLIVIIFFIT